MTTVSPLGRELVRAVVVLSAAEGGRPVDVRFLEGFLMLGPPFGDQPREYRLALIAGGLAQLERDGLIETEDKYAPLAERQSPPTRPGIALNDRVLNGER